MSAAVVMRLPGYRARSRVRRRREPAGTRLDARSRQAESRRTTEKTTGTSSTLNSPGSASLIVNRTQELGVYDPWVEKSFERLAVLRPARYRRQERTELVRLLEAELKRTGA